MLAVIASSFIAIYLNVAARSSTSGPWKHCLKSRRKFMKWPVPEPTTFIPTSSKHSVKESTNVTQHSLRLWRCFIVITRAIRQQCNRCTMCVGVCVGRWVYVWVFVCTEGPATGHLDTGFSWFPSVYKQMLRWFPTFQVATTCFSCSPPDLNSVGTDFMFSVHM